MQMFELIYVEKEVQHHPHTQAICKRFPQIATIICDRYGEIFNRHHQNFRLQKGRPSLILAQKYDNFVLPTPAGYGIGGQRNFYFSHMLNCIYDCRYCFLQGMYNSANYVIFVNFE
jgi:spore photoproduct lyase